MHVRLERHDKVTLSRHSDSVPPLDEQREIVAEIEKQFTRLEAGVAGLRRVQANLKRYRAAVLKAACEGNLLSSLLTITEPAETEYGPVAKLPAAWKWTTPIEVCEKVVDCRNKMPPTPHLEYL